MRQEQVNNTNTVIKTQNHTGLCLSGNSYKAYYKFHFLIRSAN